MHDNKRRVGFNMQNNRLQRLLWYSLLIVSLVRVQCSRGIEEDLIHTTLAEMHGTYTTLGLLSNDDVFIKKTQCFFNDTADLILEYGDDYPEFVEKCYCFSR